MTELLSALIGALAGGLITFFTTRWQIRKELEFAYDKDLRERRIKSPSKCGSCSSSSRSAVVPLRKSPW